MGVVNNSDHALAPSKDGHGVLILLAMEVWDFLLVNLQDWSIGAGDHIVVQDLLGQC